MVKARDHLPMTRTVTLTDREIDALTAPWWRRLFFTNAEWRAHHRARMILRRGSADVGTWQAIAWQQFNDRSNE